MTSLFEVSGRGIPAIKVFATSYDEAVRIFMVYWLTRYSGDLPDLEVKQRDPSWPGINREALADALALGISGIGRFDALRGWHIVPPDYYEEEA